MNNIYRFHVDDDNLAATPVDNIFINEYMPRARGDYVKVYLYGLKLALSKSDAPMDNVTLSQLFNITEGDVIAAWNYWQEQGILSVKYAGTREARITFYHIPSLLLAAGGRPAAKEAPLPADDADEGRIADMFERIQTMYGSRVLSKKDMLTFTRWIEEYTFDPETVIILVEYALNLIGRKDEAFSPAQMLAYMESIAESWHSAGIRSFSDADRYIKESEARQKRHYAVFKYLGLRRNPMAWEKEMIDTWSDRLGYDDAVITLAMSRTKKPDIRYVNGILKSWHEAGLTSLSAIEAETARAKPHKAARKEGGAPDSRDLAIYEMMDAEDAAWLEQLGEEAAHGKPDQS